TDIDDEPPGSPLLKRAPQGFSAAEKATLMEQSSRSRVFSERQPVGCEPCPMGAPVVPEADSAARVNNKQLSSSHIVPAGCRRALKVRSRLPLCRDLNHLPRCFGALYSSRQGWRRRPSRNQPIETAFFTTSPARTCHAQCGGSITATPRVSIN